MIRCREALRRSIEYEFTGRILGARVGETQAGGQDDEGNETERGFVNRNGNRIGHKFPPSICADVVTLS